MCWYDVIVTDMVSISGILFMLSFARSFSALVMLSKSPIGYLSLTVPLEIVLYLSPFFSVMV